MNRRTKIVCTLGPAVNSKEKIAELIDAGMNVARINCSHGDWETRRMWVQWIRELSPDVAPVAILADLQGPKFRIGDIEGGSIELVEGQKIAIGEGKGVPVPIDHPDILKALVTGGRLLLGDGEMELQVSPGAGPVFEATVINGGLLKSRKGVTLVNRGFETPALTIKDLDDVQAACELNVDYIALSYVKDAADVRELRRVIDRLDKGIAICAKIETREAFTDLPNILKVVDLVMVARGDMGLQMDIEDVPLLQKKIIDMCTSVGRPVITATQMLESMITSPRPTRAEATDIANAVIDGTDALMLSGETAAGAHPIECVKTMARIAVKAEELYDRTKIEEQFKERAKGVLDHTDAIAHGVSNLTNLLDIQAIVTTTSSGQTPRLVSKFRPQVPILCATWNERTMRKMAVVWGVEAVHIPLPKTTDDTVQEAINVFLRKKKLNCGDFVVVTAGVPPGVPGHTNMILTQHVE